MRKGSAIVIVVLVIAALLLAIGGWWLVNQRNRTQAPQSDGSIQNENSSSTGDNGGITNASSVSIANMAFSPSTITVKKGTAVTWTNNDSTTHNVTAGNNGFSSGSLAPGKTFSFTFDKAGSFSYTCTIHPSMKGTVVVTD